MALNGQQDKATLPGIPFRETLQQGICTLRRERDGVRPYPGGGFGPDKGQRIHGKRGAENAGHTHGRPLEKSIGRKRGSHEKRWEDCFPRTSPHPNTS